MPNDADWYEVVQDSELMQGIGSAPELSHKRTEPPRFCRACGTYPHELNAPGNNSPPLYLVPSPILILQSRTNAPLTIETDKMQMLFIARTAELNAVMIDPPFLPTTRSPIR
jgi:hypothetical protein